MSRINYKKSTSGTYNITHITIIQNKKCVFRKYIYIYY